MTTEHDQPDFDATEELLRQTFDERARSIEPGPNAFARLEQRVAEETGLTVIGATQSPSRRRRSVSMPPRILAAAAALALVFGGGALLLSQPNGSDVTADAGTTSVPVEIDEAPPEEEELAIASESADEADATASALNEIEPETPVEPLLDAAPVNYTFGPLRTTRLEAAEAFLALIRYMNLDVEVSDAEGAENTAAVFGLDPLGDPVQVATLELASRPFSDGTPGFVVVGATTEGVSIEEPAFATRRTGEDDLVVAGSGVGFEAALGIEIFAAGDGVLLHRRATQAGNFGEFAPFSEAFDVKGREYAWIVVESGVGDGDAPFAARVVQFDAPLPSTTYTVSNIALDDPDGGLLVRRAPLDGSEVSEIIEAVLPAGTSGITRRGELPVVINGATWWNVLVPGEERTTGWVNARYLTREGMVSIDTLTDVATNFSAALVSEDAAAFASLPWATDRPIRMGWSGGLVNVSAEEAGTLEFWDTEQTWDIPAEFEDGTFTASPRVFLSPTPSGSDPTVDLDLEFPDALSAVSPYGAAGVGGDVAVFESQFAGSTAVILRHPASTDSGWQHTALFIERTTEGGAHIVGTAIVFWIP